MDEDNLTQENSESVAPDEGQNTQTDSSFNGEPMAGEQVPGQAALEPNLPRWNEVAMPDNEKVKEPQKDVSQAMSGTTMAILGAAVGQIFAPQPAKEEPKKPTEDRGQKVGIKIVKNTGKKKRAVKGRRIKIKSGKK